MAFVRNAVSKYHFFQRRCLNALIGRAGHDAVRGEGAHAVSTVFHHQVGGLRNCAGRVDDVVDQDYVHAFHVADNLHAGHLVGFLARLVAEHHRTIKEFGIRACTLRTAYIGRGDAEIGQVERFDVRQHHGGGIEVVYGYVEETLFLVGVQVHCEQAVDARNAQKVGHEFGADRYARFVFTILARPAEIGDNGVDAVGRGAFGGVNHQQKFHEVVGVGERGLHEEYVAAADRLFVGHGELAVGEVRDDQISQRLI